MEDRKRFKNPPGLQEISKHGYQEIRPFIRARLAMGVEFSGRKEGKMIIDNEWRRFWQGYAMGVLSMILLFAAYVSWKF